MEHRHRGLVLEEGAGGAARVDSVERAIREHLEQGPSLLKLLLQSILDGVDGAERDPRWRRVCSQSPLALSAIHFLLALQTYARPPHTSLLNDSTPSLPSSNVSKRRE